MYEIALDQHGYFTTEQAHRVGATAQAVAKMHDRGTIERASWGLYRVSAIPAGEMDAYMEAALWPHGVRATISHETALDLYEFSDINPARIHITVPRRFRSRRRVPSRYVVHSADLDASEIGVIEGIPVTSPARTIEDCHGSHIGAALLVQAIEKGLSNGRLAADDAERLRRLILGEA